MPIDVTCNRNLSVNGCNVLFLSIATMKSSRLANPPFPEEHPDDLGAQQALQDGPRDGCRLQP
jgi:hypothetical protein